jgi:hypothetical protein
MVGTMDVGFKKQWNTPEKMPQIKFYIHGLQMAGD